jgi:phospholipid transport system substrate-binding protein
MKKRCGTLGSIVLVALAMFATTASASAENGSPASLPEVSGLGVDPSFAHSAVPVVESLHASLIEIMKTADELGYSGRMEALVPILHDSFDLEFMATKSIGRSWKKLSEQEKALWLDTFQRLTCANYAGRFHGYSGQTFETRGVAPGSHDTVMVQTTLRNPDGDDVDLNYRLIESDKGWRIIDVYLNGTVSELALRRSEYSAVLKREGFQKLLADADRRVAELASVD